MKKLFFTLIILLSIAAGCKNSGAGKDNSRDSSVKTDENSVAVYLNDQTFKELVFDYETHGKEWKYEGTKPAIIDFYADWCAPCRQLSPLLEEVVSEYDGRVILYKIDTEKEKELTRTLGITGLPTLLYIPLAGKPQVRMGLVPKESLKQAIDEILLSTPEI